MESEVSTKVLLQMILANQKVLQQNQQDIKGIQKDIKQALANHKDDMKKMFASHDQDIKHNQKVLEDNQKEIKAIRLRSQKPWQKWVWQISYFVVLSAIVILQIIDSAKQLSKQDGTTTALNQTALNQTALNQTALNQTALNEQGATLTEGLGASWIFSISCFGIAHLIDKIFDWLFEWRSSTIKIEDQPEKKEKKGVIYEPNVIEIEPRQQVMRQN